MNDENKLTLADIKAGRIAFNPRVHPPNCDPDHIEYGIYVETHLGTPDTRTWYRATWTGRLPGGIEVRPLGACIARDEAIGQCRVMMFECGILDWEGKLIPHFMSPTRSGAV